MADPANRNQPDTSLAKQEEPRVSYPGDFKWKTPGCGAAQPGTPPLTPAGSRRAGWVGPPTAVRVSSRGSEVVSRIKQWEEEDRELITRANAVGS